MAPTVTAFGDGPLRHSRSFQVTDCGTNRSPYATFYISLLVNNLTNYIISRTVSKLYRAALVSNLAAYCMMSPGRSSGPAASTLLMQVESTTWDFREIFNNYVDLRKIEFQD